MDTNSLEHSVAFDRRLDAEDGYGNTVSDWQEQFKRRASFIYAGGGEAVMAARLEGRGVLKCRVVADSSTRLIGQDWQMRDVRTNADPKKQTTYAIREVDNVTDRFWVYLVVERGVAA